MTTPPLPLCDFCRQPLLLHVGFDHGKRRCLLAGDRLDLAIHHKQDLDEVVRRLNEWSEHEMTKPAGEPDNSVTDAGKRLTEGAESMTPAGRREAWHNTELTTG